jgi:phosphoribosylformimino-5-aminoimidazole carboxamide ribotide isomerase
MATEKVTAGLLDSLEKYCSEFLVHAVDVEGKAEGIEQELVRELGKYCGLPITYAGGVRDFRDLFLLKELGNHKLNVTIGTSLDLFGGDMPFEKVISYCGKGNIPFPI